MDDRELENRIKKSAEDLQLKDFADRYQNIQKLADKEGDGEKESFFVKEPVKQSAGGGSHSGRNKLLVLAFAVVLAAAVIFTILFFTVFGKTDSDDLSAATGSNPADSAQEVSSSSATSALEIESVTEEYFYERCTQSGVDISQSFKNYDGAEYYLTDSPIGVLGGYVTFEYSGYSVTVKFYVDAEYDSSSPYIRELNGVVYVVSGTGVEIAEEILANL